MADEPTHDCPGCGVQVRFEMLACREDWYRLPESLRKLLNFWYPRRRTHSPQYEDARAKCLDWYRTNPREVADGRRG